MLEYVDHGIRLSPRDPETSIFLLLKGWAYLMMEHDEEALVWLRRAAAASPRNSDNSRCVDLGLGADGPGR